MSNLINNFKLLIIVLLTNKIYCEIIPIHIGSPNHKNFNRQPPKNEDNLRASGLIPISKNQINLNSLIPATKQNDELNQNFDFNKRVGFPLSKRSTYSLQNTRNQIDHGNSYLPTYSPQANFYEKEKQKVFTHNHEMNYSPNTYQPNTYQPNNYQTNSYQPIEHQPKNYGYIFNGNSNNYEYRPQQQYNSQYGNSQQYQPVEHYNQQPRDNLEYQQNPQNGDLEKELNDIGLDSYDMPFNDQHFDNNGGMFNDAMNLDMPNFY